MSPGMLSCVHRAVFLCKPTLRQHEAADKDSGDRIEVKVWVWMRCEGQPMLQHSTPQHFDHPREAGAAA